MTTVLELACYKTAGNKTLERNWGLTIKLQLQTSNLLQ